MILADFCCPVHGPFEARADADAETAPCTHAPVSYSTGPATGEEGPRQYFTDTCGIESPWLPSPVAGSVKLGEVSRGKSDAKPGPMALDYRELAEGMPMSEFKAKRKKLWDEWRWKKNKAAG